MGIKALITTTLGFHSVSPALWADASQIVAEKSEAQMLLCDRQSLIDWLFMWHENRIQWAAYCEWKQSRCHGAAMRDWREQKEWYQGAASSLMKMILKVESGSVFEVNSLYLSFIKDGWV